MVGPDHKARIQDDPRGKSRGFFKKIQMRPGPVVTGVHGIPDLSAFHRVSHRDHPAADLPQPVPVGPGGDGAQGQDHSVAGIDIFLPGLAVHKPDPVLPTRVRVRLQRKTTLFTSSTAVTPLRLEP